MNEVKVDTESRDLTPTSSQDDFERKELPWESREEILLIEWSEDFKKKSNQHAANEKKNKILFGLFSIPAILIALTLAGMSEVIPCNSHIYGICMSVSAVFNGINMFFNFGKKTEEHHNFSNKYFQLHSEIQCELSKPKKHRVACDLYMEKIKYQYFALSKYCPSP
jgi:hypothetical protein